MFEMLLVMRMLFSYCAVPKTRHAHAYALRSAQSPGAAGDQPPMPE
jgi:hypothetical protein